MNPNPIGARPTVAGFTGGGLNVEYAAAFDDYVQRKAKEIGLDLATVVTATTNGTPFAGTVAPPAGPASPMAPADWKDLDLFIGSTFADVAPNAQTGHPCAVVPYKLAVPEQPRVAPGAAPSTPICAVITGALYADDKILSVAHRFQVHDDVYLKHPTV
jgi:hypothetical protein